MQTQKRFFEYRRNEKIEAGRIERHPVHQRKSVERQFKQKLGEFDLYKCLEPIHVVEREGQPGQYFAVNGATRVEACKHSKRYGPSTKLDCVVYGNGVPPTDSELDELFLILNTDHISVGGETKFERSVGAGRENAVFANEMLRLLGKRFKGRVGVWNIVEAHGKDATRDAVEFCLNTWGPLDPPSVRTLRAVAWIYEEGSFVKALRSRRRALRGSEAKKQNSRNIDIRSDNRRLKQMGVRDSALVWTVRVLLGRENQAGDQPFAWPPKKTSKK